MASKPRTRRSVDDARRQILDAAQRRLIAGGPDAVRVQLVARDIGLSDAAVHYHFGSRGGLLEALLAEAGRRLKNEVQTAVDRWDPGVLDVAELVRSMQRTFEAEGHARLSAWMTLGGWKPQGAGMLRGLGDAVHDVRVELATAAGLAPPSLEDTLFSIELLALVLWAEALSGDAWRRSVRLPADRETADRFTAWFAEMLSSHLRGAAHAVSQARPTTGER